MKKEILRKKHYERPTCEVFLVESEGNLLVSSPIHPTPGGGGSTVVIPTTEEEEELDLS